MMDGLVNAEACATDQRKEHHCHMLCRMCYCMPCCALVCRWN